MTKNVKIGELSGGLPWYYLYNNFNDYFSTIMYVFHLLITNNYIWTVIIFLL